MHNGSEDYKRRLLEFIRLEYGIEAVGISPAKRGFYGETWRVDAARHSYFVKLDRCAAHMGIYERSFPVLEHLWRHGIDFVSKIVKTADGRLSTRYDGGVLGVFDWLDGENIESDETKPLEYQMLARIYNVAAQGVSIPREDFSGGSAERFFAQWEQLCDGEVRALFERNRAKLERRAARLRKLCAQCRADMTGFVITHGDAGGNLIIGAGRSYIIDWDAPLLAPPERDAWNMLFCKGKEWAGCLFHKALRDSGLSYSLRPERLAYYCYYHYFLYLTEHLDNFERPNARRELEEYFDGWAENRAAHADRCCWPPAY